MELKYELLADLGATHSERKTGRKTNGVVAQRYNFQDNRRKGILHSGFGDRSVARDDDNSAVWLACVLVGGRGQRRETRRRSNRRLGLQPVQSGIEEGDL